MTTCPLINSAMKSQDIKTHEGFVEMLKTPDSGQFSYFTAHQVLQGVAIITYEDREVFGDQGKSKVPLPTFADERIHEQYTSGEKPTVVDTIPGWAHDITNVGDDEMVVMLWANENFHRQKPDTVAHRVE